MRNPGLVGRVCGDVTRLSEMRNVDAARKRVDVVMLMPLRFVQRLTTGQYQRRAPQQCGLAILQQRRRALESRQLVHAVVDDGARREVVCEGEGHWCVVPEQVIADAF